MDSLFRKVKNHPRGGILTSVILEDIMYLISNTAVIHFWRGIWDICDFYILVDNPGLSSLVTSLSVIILQVFHVGNTVVSKGCFIDGQTETEEFGILFPNLYIRYYKYRGEGAEVDDTMAENGTVFIVSHAGSKPITAVRPMLSNGGISTLEQSCDQRTTSVDLDNKQNPLSVNNLNKCYHMMESEQCHQQVNGFIRKGNGVVHKSNIKRNSIEFCQIESL